MSIYLVKENPKLIVNENQSNSIPRISLENNNTFILKLEILNIEEFKTIEVNQDSYAKIDLTNSFDSDMYLNFLFINHRKKFLLKLF